MPLLLIVVAKEAEFPIISSTLEEPVRVSEEPKEYIVNLCEDIFLKLPIVIASFFWLIEAASLRKTKYNNNGLIEED